MSGVSRRDFVFLSSGAAVGHFVAPGLVAADWSRSGLVTGEPKPLRHREIPGFLSAEQLAPHHTAHYGGALRGYLAAEAQLEEAAAGQRAIDAAAFGAWKRIVSSRGNSVVLHEMYFDGLAARRPDPHPQLRAAIESRFGSLEKWAHDFVASAREAAGWAMLVRHPVNGRLYNVVSDEHAHGVLWMAAPLVVIDTYEHAFYIDYQNRKAEYIDKFLDHIDWDEAQRRFSASRAG